MIGFNSQFTTKPADAKSAVTKPLEAKPFVNGVDEYEVEELTLPGSTDRSTQAESVPRPRIHRRRSQKALPQEVLSQRTWHRRAWW